MNKTEIFFHIVLVLSAIIVSFFPPLPGFAVISALFVVVFALPSFNSLIREIGWKIGCLVLVLLGVFALLIESFAILTGFPYGHFVYGDMIGEKIANLVPWTVPFAWTPIVIGAVALSHRLVQKLSLRILVGVIFVVLSDVVLDPGAVALKYWIWEEQGIYYGVPLSNFFGWLVSGLYGVGLLILVLHERQILEKRYVKLWSSLYYILVFWSAVNLFNGIYVSFIIGIILLFFMRRLTLKIVL